ncbi:MAG TPA: amidohydrolase [Candidatus Acidoferrales bacterium]|nr:amidohydrolase [Candidatus Acidoferrales bacterium]
MPRLLTIMLVSILFVGPATAQRSAPDLILLNGKIFTSDSSHPYVEALAIRGDRIAAVGASEKIASLAGPQTKRIDLKGRVAIPGINDAHYHLPLNPAIFHMEFRTQDPSWQEVSDELAAAVSKSPKGTFIIGDIGPTVLYSPQATRTTLDRLAPDHPVILNVWTGHASISNTAALRKLGVKDDEPNPLGGFFAREPGTKDLTGAAFEFAQFRLGRRLAELASQDEALRQTRDYISNAVRLGITSVQVMSIPPSAAQLVSLFGQAPTPIRVRVMRFLLTDRNRRLTQEGLDLPAKPAPLVTVSGTKWVLDGTPIERSSAMRKPYADEPDTSGQMDFTEKDMEAMLGESLANHDQLLVHVTGDLTTETFLDAMDATGGRTVWPTRRVRIEHGDGLAPDLIPRAKDLGVIVVQNPTHLALRELLLSRWGIERADQLQPLQSLLKAGIPLALGSDGPFNPYLNIMLASLYPGKPQEAITREQAVIAYTLTAAYAEFAEKDKGSLETGKLADLAVLSQDIFHAPPDDLPKTQSVLTIVGGKIVYDAKVVSAN